MFLSTKPDKPLQLKSSIQWWMRSLLSSSGTGQHQNLHASLRSIVNLSDSKHISDTRPVEVVVSLLSNFERPKMGRHFNSGGFLDVLVLHLAAASMILTTSYAKTIPGFVSIDCGSNRESYFDNVTTLTWENDSRYISTGKDAEVDISTLSGAGYSYPNLNALQTFRYFPEHHNKYCYALGTPTTNISVLIRATFYVGDFGSPPSDKLKLPINFQVAVNATIWFSVVYDYYYPRPEVFEGIFYSPGGIINVCLLPKAGVPFISSLELRPLDKKGLMYSFEDSKKRYLVTKSRINFSNVTNSTVRFPDDNFDRLWESLGVSGYNDLGLFGSSCSIGQNSSFVAKPREGSSGSGVLSGAIVNNVPSEVMADAVQFSADNIFPSLGIDFSAFYSTNSEQISLVNSAYVILYFQDLQSISSPSGMLTMNVNFASYKELNFSVTNDTTMQAFNDLILESNSLSLFLTTPMDPTASPFLNAMEIYEEEFFDPSATFPTDEYGIRLLQQIFNFSEKGDPCFPVPYDWLLCDDYGDGTITSVMLPMANMGPGHDGKLSNNLSHLHYNTSSGALLFGLPSL